MAVRVLLLTQWFEPEPAFKGLVFARELQRQGFEVEVLTGFPNYPGGRLYPGYRVRWLQREVLDGIPVTRVPLYPSHDQSAFRRVLNYASFAASVTLWGLVGLRRPDVIYAYHPPLTVGMAAALLRLLRGIPVVYDIQDLWPDTLRATGMIGNERVLRLVGAVCQWVYKRIDHITVLSPGFKRLLAERGVPKDKLTVVPNWADEKALAEPHGTLPGHFPGPDRFTVLFAGNMGRAQALGTVLGAAERLQQQGSRVTFVLLGAGLEVENLKTEAARRQLGNVIFFPAVPMAEVGLYLQAADALLVHLKHDPLFSITIPSKTQAYLAVGKPVLMGVEGDAADMVAQADAGVAFEPESPEALARAAEHLAVLGPEALAQMGARGRAFYREQLSLEVGVAQFGAIFRRLGEAGAT